LGRACHALHDARKAYERSKERLRTDDPDASQPASLPLPSSESIASEATDWARAQCAESCLDWQALQFTMEINASTVRKRVQTGDLDGVLKKRGRKQKIPALLYDTAAAKSNASQIAGTELKPKILAREIALAFQSKHGGPMPDVAHVLQNFRQRHPELITDKCMRVDSARWDHAHYKSYKEVRQTVYRFVHLPICVSTCESEPDHNWWLLCALSAVHGRLEEFSHSVRLRARHATV
jgi:hypothetical protein